MCEVYFKKWLKSRCNDFEWISLENYPYVIENKIFKIIDSDNEETFGQILSLSEDKTYTVWYQDRVQTKKLEDTPCFVDKGTVTNRDFCIEHGFKFLNYLRSCKDIDMTISDKEFINYFSQIIYFNSGA